ncbi:MAG: ThiJ/PfpI family protein [Frankiales bacterium]|nr:ThiJ/PfpI family protein [Frankiales bacterium]
MARVLLPLPDSDFDVTEVAVPWKLLTEAGHDVVFATEQGTVPAADRLLLTGVLFGRLGAEPEPKQFYAEMLPAMTPITWEAIDTSYDALLLPGGHAPGMRQYLGSELLRQRIRDFWDTGRPVAAICHGVLPLARAGVLKGVHTTCLPKYMERSAYLSTAWLRGRYYRTYPAYVEDEVRASGAVFERGPRVLNRRGTRTEHSAAFTVRDGRYLSARWPGDAYLFAQQLLEMV